MSLKVVAYVPFLSKELLPRIAADFAEFGMACEFDANFALDPLKDSGFVQPGFEISFKDFRYTAPLSVSPQINEKLKQCTKQVIMRMHATPRNALRFGLYFAAFLAQLTDGIVYMPRSDDFLDPEEALVVIAKEVAAYETWE